MSAVSAKSIKVSAASSKCFVVIQSAKQSVSFPLIRNVAQASWCSTIFISGEQCLPLFGRKQIFCCVHTIYFGIITMGKDRGEEYMGLSKYDGKHVRAADIFGGIHIGVADYYDSGYCLHEFGENEDAVIIEGFLVYESQIASIEETEVHGCAELRTERLILRRYRPEDADDLYRYLGTDPAMYAYTGWNPYATLEMSKETVRRLIDCYDDKHVYSWVMDADDVIVGTIGAYDYQDDHIEVGFSIVKAWQGRGLATEALKKVLEYLTENEKIPCVTAWCAAENIGSRRVLEKAGMKHVLTEMDGLTVGGSVYDKLTYHFLSPAVTRSMHASE